MRRYFTTIDFGNLTRETDIQRIVEAAGMELVENSRVPNCVDNRLQARRRWRAGVSSVART